VDISQVTFQIRVVSRIATAADALGAAASSALAAIWHGWFGRSCTSSSWRRRVGKRSAQLIVIPRGLECDKPNSEIPPAPLAENDR
jgi:hypothetical protein